MNVEKNSYSKQFTSFIRPKFDGTKSEEKDLDQHLTIPVFWQGFLSLEKGISGAEEEKKSIIKVSSFTLVLNSMLAG